MNDEYEYIRLRYRVPARAGARVRYDQRPGTVVGVDRFSSVLIRLDGETQARPYHPRWMLTWDDEEGPAAFVPRPALLAPPVWPAIRSQADLGESQWSGV